MPNNCTECEHYKTCKSYFGGLGCKQYETDNKESEKASE